jgi:hypothetical protein
MTVIEEIAAERKRQIEAEGWTPEHDDAHVGGELALGAACYALPSDHRPAPKTIGGGKWRRQEHAAPQWWPWDWFSWKPATPRRDLIRAGALIVAEIERLDRVRVAGEGDE